MFFFEKAIIFLVAHTRLQLLIRVIVLGCFIELVFRTMLHAAPIVVRTSEDLRGNTYATVWGEGFVKGKTAMKIRPLHAGWTEVQAQAALDAGGADYLTPALPLENADRLEPLSLQSDLLLIKLSMPEKLTPTALWVETNNQSSPVWVVNRPQLWWLSTDRASPGERVRGFGRNLIGGLPEKPPLIFIKREGEPGRKCHFAGGGIDGDVVDPLSLKYETSFVLPQDTPPGHYRVWFHAGVGGPYGWSRPHQIEIVPPDPISNLIVDVRRFGAKADGVSDDTLPIVRAIKKVQEAGSGTVVLPAGTLLISNVIAIPANVNLRGAGMDASIIAINTRKEFQGVLNIDPLQKTKAEQRNVPHWNQDYRMLLWVQTRSCLSDFSLNMDGLNSGCGVLLDNGKDESQDCVFERIRAIFHLPEYKIGLAGKWIEDVHSCRSFSSVRRVRVSNCRDFGVAMEYGRKAWYSRGERNFNSPGINGAQIAFSLIEENIIHDIYSRRGIMGAGQYVALFRNRVEETWLLSGGGEQYLREGGYAKPYPVVSASADKLTIENSPATGAEGWYRVDDLTAVIASGKGKWQVRRIIGFVDGAYQVDRPWDIPPDKTTTAAIGPLQCRSLYVRNYSGGGNNSLSLYMGNVEQIVAGHKFRNSAMMINFGDSQKWATAWFNEFRDCDFHRGDGIESQVSVDGTKDKLSKLPIPIIAGCEWRNNLLEDIGFSNYGGSKRGDLRWKEMFTQGAITIHTVRRGSQYDGESQYGHLLTGNTIRRPHTGSGIFVDNETSNIFVAGNKFEDCPTNVSHYGRDRYEEDN